MILAAGLGTRLRPLTNLMPKPLAPVANRPVMEHIGLLLARHGFTEVITNVSYMPEMIRERFGDGTGIGLDLTYSEEPEPLGTAGGVGLVRDFLSAGESFLIISGDALTDIDLGAMLEHHESHDGIATLATKRVEDTTQFGVAIADGEGRISAFQEKPDPAEALSDLANCGIYMFRNEIFEHFPPAEYSSPAGDPDQPAGFVDWATDVFPALLDDDIPFFSHETEAYWNDIGTLGEYVQGNHDALRGLLRVELEGEEILEGVWAADGADLDGITASGPVVIGRECSIGAGAVLTGPVAVGAGAKIGAGAELRDAVVLPGASVPGGATVIGGAFAA